MRFLVLLQSSKKKARLEQMLEKVEMRLLTLDYSSEENSGSEISEAISAPMPFGWVTAILYNIVNKYVNVSRYRDVLSEILLGLVTRLDKDKIDMFWI